MGSWEALGDGFPVCTHRGGGGGPPPPPPHTDAPPDVDFVHPGLNVIGTGAQGMAGFDTYQLTVSFESTDVDNVYAIFGSPAVTSGEDAGTPAKTMSFPPVFQSGQPFGSNIGGSNPQFWMYDPNARYDSWLTIGIVDGQNTDSLSSIGIDWDSWGITNGITVTNGAVFCMDPTRGSTANPTVIAQISVAHGAAWTAVVNARGKRSDRMQML